MMMEIVVMMLMMIMEVVVVMMKMGCIYDDDGGGCGYGDQNDKNARKEQKHRSWLALFSLAPRCRDP